MTRDRANVCVFGPTLFLAVTVENGEGERSADEMHFHPAGQGFWIARMLRHLGEEPVFVAPVGGEAGRVLRGLVLTWEVEPSFVEIAEDSPAYVHDRRSGERRELARSRTPHLGRHEVDDLYARVLEGAANAGTCVITGREQGDGVPLDLYRRLGADLASTGVKAIGDLHGAELEAFLEGGPLHTLKLSDEDLVEDGVLAREATLDERVEAVARYRRMGAERVVLSSRERTVASFVARGLLAVPPALAEADHRGAGDAMTAGLTAAAMMCLDDEETLRLACAAGASSVTRRGLCNADAALVRSLAGRVTVEPLEVPG